MASSATAITHCHPEWKGKFAARAFRGVERPLWQYATPTIVGLVVLSRRRATPVARNRKLLRVLRLRNRFAMRSSFRAQDDRSISFFGGGGQVQAEPLDNHVPRSLRSPFTRIGVCSL